MSLATEGSSSKPGSPRWYCNTNNKDNLIIPQGISSEHHMQGSLLFLSTDQAFLSREMLRGDKDSTTFLCPFLNLHFAWWVTDKGGDLQIYIYIHTQTHTQIHIFSEAWVLWQFTTPAQIFSFCTTADISLLEYNMNPYKHIPITCISEWKLLNPETSPQWYIFTSMVKIHSTYRFTTGDVINLTWIDLLNLIQPSQN